MPGAVALLTYRAHRPSPDKIAQRTLTANEMLETWRP